MERLAKDVHYILLGPLVRYEGYKCRAIKILRAVSYERECQASQSFLL
jgi:hypothetical protein